MHSTRKKAQCEADRRNRRDGGGWRVEGWSNAGQWHWSVIHEDADDWAEW